MKKRRTIGENPLDAEFTEIPLDAVVPTAEGSRPAPAEPPDRLRELEEELAAVRAELAALKAELAALQAQSSHEPWWLGRLKEKLADK